GRGDRHHPGAALARHGHRGRGGGRRHLPRGARRARARRARGAARPLPPPRGGRGDHRLGPRLAGRAPRRLEPLRGRPRPHLRRALAVRDPDWPHREPAPARHPAHRGDPPAARGRPEFVRDFERDIQGYAERFKVRPGLTGYAQVNGEYHTSPATKLKYDLAYIYNRSLWLDVRILADTVKVMLTRRGV